MKKFLATVLLAVISVVAAIGFTACNNGSATVIDVYAPDGAPALALAKLMHEENDFGENVSYHIVDAGTLASRVTAEEEDKNADLIIMPVNMASKLLTDGSRYKMLGAVTHGNLYILANKDTEPLTKDNFAQNISGKRVGVINLSEFPGVMFNTLLADYEVEAELSSVDAQSVLGTDKTHDYFIVPEPAASTKAGNAATELAIVGSVQELYGEGGYPQAVIMAKTALIESNPAFINNFTDALIGAGEWLMSDSVTSDMILSAIKAHYPDPDNTTPAFTNLTKNVISGCAVRFEEVSSCKTAVQSLLTKFKAVNAQFAKEVNDSFFYMSVK